MPVARYQARRYSDYLPQNYIAPEELNNKNWQRFFI